MSMFWWLSGWILWCLVVGAALIGWVRISAKAATHETIYVADSAQVLLLTLLASWFYLIPEWEKLHLLWLAPLFYGVATYFKITRDVALD